MAPSVPKVKEKTAEERMQEALKNMGNKQGRQSTILAGAFNQSKDVKKTLLGQ